MTDYSTAPDMNRARGVINERQPSRSHLIPLDAIPLVTQAHGEMEGHEPRGTAALDERTSSEPCGPGMDSDVLFASEVTGSIHRRVRSLSPDSLLQNENKASSPREKGTWLWEILNMLFSISCVIAIAVILSNIQGNTLLSWKIPISPNATIAILSTASKASMILAVAESISQLKWLQYDQSRQAKDLQIFDEASRGPWGSLKLFWGARRVSLMTYVGCVVTVAAIALDPFTQQILSYVQQPYVVSGVYSSVNRSLDYDNREAGLTRVYMNMLARISSAARDGPLQAAALSGIYDFVSPPPFVCPGSNCTYPAFVSLGICNRCEDVTSATLTSCVTGLQDTSQNCTFTTPNGLQVQGWAEGDNYYGFRYTHINSTLSNAHPFCRTVPACVSSYSPLLDWEAFVVLLDTSFIRFDPKYETNEHWASNPTLWRDTLEAYECTYQLCLVEYDNWTSVNGTINPGTRRHWPLNGTVVGLDGGLSIMLNYTLSGLPNEKGEVPPVIIEGDGRKIQARDRVFKVNAYDLLNMARVLQNMTQYSNPSGPGDGNDAQNGNNLVLNRLFNSGAGGLPTTLDRLALAMSYQMLSGPNSTAVNGDLWATQTYIRVHWAWLSLTVTLVALAAGFLCAVVLASWKTQQPLWKSSLAPLLSDQAHFRGSN